MRKEYGKVLRQLVEHKMKESTFGWQLHREKSIYAAPGERAFRKDVDRNLTLWCILVPNQKLESFTLEVGWSKLGRYPQLSVRPSPESHDRAGDREEYVVRLGELFQGEDYWWEIERFRIPTDVNDLMQSLQLIPPEQAELRVLPKVEEALAALELHGEPYLLKASGASIPK